MQDESHSLVLTDHPCTISTTHPSLQSSHQFVMRRCAKLGVHTCHLACWSRPLRICKQAT